MTAFDAFHIGEDFHAVRRAFQSSYGMRVGSAKTDDLQPVGNVVVVEPDNVTGQPEISDGMRSVESAGRGEAGELAFYFCAASWSPS